MRPAYVALGSNLGSFAGTPADTVRAGMEALASAGAVLARSSLYQTAPVGYSEQPDFINAVVHLRTTLEPGELLSRMLTIEQRFGRDRRQTERNRPRTLDLDLLLFDDLVLVTPELTVPHPELTRRRFVLEPLAEIAPELQHPILRSSMASLLAALPSAGPNAADAVKPVAEAVAHP